jgi:DNA-binding PadR family transcriptional regulator
MSRATLDRLHAKGYIADPKSRDKSVAMTEEGKARAEELFYQLFGTAG